MNRNPTVRRIRRRNDLQRQKSRLGVLARERARRQRAEECGDWRRVATLVLVVTAASDGRSVGLLASGGSSPWERCGTERAVRAALARMLWARRATA